MRRFLTIMLTLVLSTSIWGQIQLTTRKVKFEDFTQKTTKVVLTGNVFYDSALKDEISERWRLSPYEFCSLDEFETIRTSEEYYFLLTTKGKFRKEKEPGINFLSLVKGGKDADKGIDKMLEVVSIPLCQTEEPSGREFVFLPALIDIIQYHTELSMRHDSNAYLGLAKSASYMSGKLPEETVLMITPNDLGDEPRKFLHDKHQSRLVITEEENLDQAMENFESGKLISYVVAPKDAVRGSWCYKMVINPEDRTLFWYKKSRITNSFKAGFYEGDIRQVLELLESKAK